MSVTGKSRSLTGSVAGTCSSPCLSQAQAVPWICKCTSKSPRSVTDVGIYKRKILRNKERKHAFDQEKTNIKEKKANTLSAKKKKKKTRS